MLLTLFYYYYSFLANDESHSTLMHVLSVVLTSPLVSTKEVLVAWSKQKEEQQQGKEGNEGNEGNDGNEGNEDEGSDKSSSLSLRSKFIFHMLGSIGRALEWRVKEAEETMDR
jgi:hypothetical protein